MSQYSGSTPKQLLHGRLKIEVREAKQLPDMEGFLSKLVSKKDVTDPFVDIKLGKAKVGKTSMVLNSLSPIWNETYHIEVCHCVESLKFEVKDQDHLYSELIGTVEIPSISLMNGAPQEGWFPIMNTKTKQMGLLHLFVQFTSRFVLSWFHHMII